MWMTSACGANSESLPVTRSEKRAPQAMMRSDSVIARLAYFEPCMPTGPMLSGLDAGNAPLPMSVVTTGMLQRVGQLDQFIGGTGADHAAADVEHGAFGALDALDRRADLLGVAAIGGA